MTSKKQLILWVLNILNTESDEDNPLTQTKIANIISEVYPCDRKTVGRNIKFLREMGYPIIKTSAGFYMGRKMYTLRETEFVVKCILDSDASDFEKQDLVSRIKKTMGYTYI